MHIVPLRAGRHSETIPDTMARYVHPDEAAKALGVSRRTIERRIQKGDIVASYVNGKRYVHISDNGATVPTVTHDSRTTDSDTGTQIATLRTELDTIRQERDYLRQHVSQLTATLYRLGDQKAFSTPQHPEPRPTPWWAFWKPVRTTG